MLNLDNHSIRKLINDTIRNSKAKELCFDIPDIFNSEDHRVINKNKYFKKIHLIGTIPDDPYTQSYTNVNLDDYNNDNITKMILYSVWLDTSLVLCSNLRNLVHLELIDCIIDYPNAKIIELPVNVTHFALFVSYSSPITCKIHDKLISLRTNSSLLTDDSEFTDLQYLYLREMYGDMTKLLAKANSNTIIDIDNRDENISSTLYPHLCNKKIFINIFKHDSEYPNCLDIFRNTLHVKCFEYLHSLTTYCKDIKYVNEILEMPNLCCLTLLFYPNDKLMTVDFSKIKNNTSIHNLTIDTNTNWNERRDLLKIKNFRPNKSLVVCKYKDIELIKPKIVDKRFVYKSDKTKISLSQNNIIHNDIVTNYIKEYL